mgnify:FL=1
MTKPRISSLTTLAGAGIAVAAMACASVWVGASPSRVDGTAQSAHPSQVRLACPSGVVDPFETTSVAAGSTWSSLASAPTSPAPASITGNGGVIPTALTLAGQGGGELAGLSAVGCAAPRTSQWIATGATTSGADMVLILSNPGPTASVVSIDGYGASGPLNAAPRQVTVPASSSVSVLLAGWFPDENSLALHVRADGGGVAAWVQASLMNGEIPQGTTLASAVVPATSQTILGVDPKGTSLLRLVSPSGDARVSVSVADSTGVHPLPGGQATVAEGTTLEMPLDGASSDATPIVFLVTSDREVVAQTTTITVGAPWAERLSAWIMRSNASPATTFTEASVPGVSQLTMMTTSVLSSTPLRATSVATDSGVNASSASLLLYAPADAAGAATASQGDTAQSAVPGPSATPDIWASPSPVTSQSGTSQSGQSRDAQSSGTSASTPGAVPVRVGDRTIYLAPGVPTLVNLPDSASTISADTPIQAALVITADTAVGRMNTTWNVGTEGISAVTGAIRTAN